jgi:hypothetical protein
MRSLLKVAQYHAWFCVLELNDADYTPAMLRWIVDLCDPKTNVELGKMRIKSPPI